MLIVVSLFPFYFLGLGFLLVLTSAQLFDRHAGSGMEKARLLALLLVFGVMVNYLLVLILENLTISLVTGTVLSLAGIVLAVKRIGRGIIGLFNIGWIRWGLFLYIAMLYAVPILFDPLSAGDARSIWFFHGKMIFYNGSFDGGGGWAAKSIAFSHVDYPKLVGVIAAQFASVAGFWNEYLPKASLLVLLVAALLGLLSFLDRNWFSFTFLLAFLVFSLGGLLWNGYMDGYLALYAGVAAIFLGRWLERREQADLLAGAIFLGVVGNLKNEGILFILSVLACLTILFLVVRLQNPHAGTRFSFQRWFWLPVAVPSSAYLLWAGKKFAWGLKNDLQLGTGSIGKISERIADDSPSVIGRFLMEDAFVAKAIVLFLIVLVVAKTARIRLPLACWFALLTASVYFSGMFMIYLATPADLGWHLATSARRTMLPVLLMLFAAAFFLLRGVEEQISPDRKHTRAEEGEHS